MSAESKIKLILRVIPFLILNEYQLLLLTFDKLFQYLHSCKSCENRPVWGALKFQALWSLAEGLLYFYKLFFRKRRILD